MRFPAIMLTPVVCLLAVAAARAEVIDGVAAYVNDVVITVSEVDRVFQARKQSLAQLYEGAELEARLRTGYRDALELLIENRLIVCDYRNRVEKKEMKIPDQVLKQRVDSLVRRAIGDDKEALMDALARDGMTMEEMRKPFEDRVIITIMQNIEIDAKVQVNPREVRKEYFVNADKYATPARVRLRGIVFNLGSDEEANARLRRKAEIVHTDVTAGGDLEAAITAISKTPEGQGSGDLGWYNLGDLRQELADAVKDAPVGTLTPVVESGGRLYVVRIEEHKEAGMTAFEAVQADLESEIRQRKSAQLYDEWMARLKNQAYINIPDAALFGPLGTDRADGSDR